jgi:hypothetical protein
MDARSFYESGITLDLDQQMCKDFDYEIRMETRLPLL